MSFFNQRLQRTKEVAGVRPSPEHARDILPPYGLRWDWVRGQRRAHLFVDCASRTLCGAVVRHGPLTVERDVIVCPKCYELARRRIA